MSSVRNEGIRGNRDKVLIRGPLKQEIFYMVYFIDLFKQCIDV